MSAEFILGGNGKTQVKLLGSQANRHGVIAGATGTGKTVSLQVLAEGFSKMGVPVFMADVKGDLSGMASEGKPHKKIDERLAVIGLEGYKNDKNPVIFWDLFARMGHPMRATVSDMGPLLISNLLELNDTQTGVLYSTFAVADDEGLLMLDLKDLRSMLHWVGENASELKSEYGNIAQSSVGAIQRKLLVLEEQGAEHFFGEPALKLDDLMMTDFSGRGVVNIMDVTDLVSKAPRLYASFLLWLMSELFENLPEVGDPEKPKLVLFFDEAHLLFNRAPQPLLDKIEQVVRLIRSKGVGVYFISQSPMDIPQAVMAQLGSRIQHALRAYTPREKKAVNIAAETFRQNPTLDTAEAITQLTTGEALVSTLDAEGAPSMVERILICPPESRIGPLTESERSDVMNRSPIRGRYDETIDRESAYEMLKVRSEIKEKERQEELERAAKEKEERRGSRRQSMGEAIVKSVARSVASSVGRQLGRQIIRGILGSLLK